MDDLPPCESEPSESEPLPVDEDVSEHQIQFELDEEGNQIPVIQIPLSDLISDTGIVRNFNSEYSDSGSWNLDCNQRLDAEMRSQSEDRLSVPQHSCLPSPALSVSCTPVPDTSKQAKNTTALDAARAQMAVSAVYNNLIVASNANPATISSKGCLELGNSVLSNGPDRLHTTH